MNDFNKLFSNVNVFINKFPKSFSEFTLKLCPFFRKEPIDQFWSVKYFFVAFSTVKPLIPIKNCFEN